MHPVRTLRFLFAAALAGLGIVAIFQTEWGTVATAFLASLVAVLGAMGVRVSDKAEVEVVRASGWRHREPWAWPLYDLTLGLMLVFTVGSVVLPALP